MPTTSGDCVANRNPQPRPEAEAQGDPAEEIEAGKRLVRIGGDRGVSLAERIASQFRLLAWKSPLHRMRLRGRRSEEHTSELQSLMRSSYAVFCLKNKTQIQIQAKQH